jgi:hypothetical protein
MGIHAEVEVVEEVVQVNLPVKFGVGRLREGTASLFTTGTILQEFLIDIEGLTQLLSHFVVEVTLKFNDTLRTLMIHLGLTTVRIGFVVFLGNH